MLCPAMPWREMNSARLEEEELLRFNDASHWQAAFFGQDGIQFVSLPGRLMPCWLIICCAVLYLLYFWQIWLPIMNRDGGKLIIFVHDSGGWQRFTTCPSESEDWDVSAQLVFSECYVPETGWWKSIKSKILQLLFGTWSSRVADEYFFLSSLSLTVTTTQGIFPNYLRPYIKNI